jgi:Adenylosuccinate synthetase
VKGTRRKERAITNVAVIGAPWGDEGNGKIVDLAQPGAPKSMLPAAPVK